MEKPRCKVCTARHYTREPHVLEGPDRGRASRIDQVIKADVIDHEVKPQRKKGSVTRRSSVTKTLTGSVTGGSVTEKGSTYIPELITPGSTKQEKWRGRNAERYKAQRREYMRAYRQRKN